MLQVDNPPDFRGFPEHDRDDPTSRPETHGLDPDLYFVHWESEHPLFVEHATGFPRFEVIDGELIPIPQP